MPIVLFRVDERLIHGQVVIGWGHALRPERYLVVDDDLAESAWEQELYALAATGVDVEFLTVGGARDRLDGWRADPTRSILLTRDVRSMARLGEGGALADEQVNLGGLHHEPGKSELLPYLFVTREDREELRRLADSGAEVSARDLPDASRVPLADLIEA